MENRRRHERKEEVFGNGKLFIDRPKENYSFDIKDLFKDGISIICNKYIESNTIVKLTFNIRSSDFIITTKGFISYKKELKDKYYYGVKFIDLPFNFL